MDNTTAFRCDCCSAPALAIIRLLGLSGDQMPRACFRCLPRLFARLDLDAAIDGYETASSYVEVF